ncbi:MAG TPA: MFS transporter [Solirubrobacter sp.]|nr:MFS transporter [Solirubrobacter sp.]
MSIHERRPWALLALLVAAQFMVVLDISIVNVALPSIGAGLGFAKADLQWVVTAYVVFSGGLLLVGGRAADLFGRRRVFLAGLSLFTLASLACGLAPSAGALVTARAAQGAGAALLTPAALSIITATYSGAQRATALSIWGAIASAGVAVGVLLGGVLTTALSWHWVFLVNLPVGLAALALAPRVIPAFAPERRSLDLPGALAAVTGLALLVYALAGAAEDGWSSARTLLPLAAAAALLAAFARIERSVRAPLLTPSVWRVGSLVSGTLMMLGVTGVMVGMFFVNSLYLQGVLGWSALETGLAFLPFVGAITLGVHGTQHAIGRVGSRALMVAGLALVAAGALLLAVAPDQASYAADLLPGFVVLGLGMGLAFPAISITAMNDVTHGLAGAASGMLSTAHEIGAALGVAVLSAIALAGSGLDYGAATLAAAVVAAALAILAAAVVPVVRPAAGAHVTVH